MSQSSGAIESNLQENRVFPPSPAFAAKARIKSMSEYQTLWKKSIDQPEQFWSEIASQLHWFKKWDKVLDWQLPYAKWFVGGQTNVSYNCLDRQIEAGFGDKTAIIFEGAPVDGTTPRQIDKYTYSDLRDAVCKLANGLKRLGVKKGDRVTIYLPMVAEAAIAMLACARIGAAHSVIFGGFSSQAIVDRVTDAQSHFVITADGGFRRGQIVPLKKNVDEALK
ncbi:MAG TPA: acetyl-coenzyme A synthetase N-terminal domain-containing protein, partial [Tepidisphaeraceae bacterium]|nr:acetyl-coenzyme A synthetase N-terminal domain-containing protein [Tepidisphaeraceae bacterium]